MQFLRLFILSSLFVSPAFGQAVWNGKLYSSRVCSNPNCAMCASIQAQLSKPVAQSPEYTLQAVQRHVKRCNGRTCWYETVTEYIRVPVRSVASTPKAMPDLEAVTELAPTPQRVVIAMLEALRLRESDVLYDLGCGDGRFLITAAKHYGCRGVGIEINPESVELARNGAAADFVTPLVTIFEGDIRNYDLAGADAVVMYLYPELMGKVIPKLPKGTRVASYMHPIPGAEERRVGEDTFYIGVIR